MLICRFDNVLGRGLGEVVHTFVWKGLTCMLSWEWRKGTLAGTWKAPIDSWLRKCLGCIYIMLFLFLLHKKMKEKEEKEGG
jgi:hypothetical protein